MSVYDNSPAAIQQHRAKQASVGRWAVDSSSQASHYSHPFQAYAGTSASSTHRGKPSRSATMPSHAASSSSYASSHSAATIRPSSGTVVSKRANTVMAPGVVSKSSASRSYAPSRQSSHHGSIVSASSRTSGSSHRSQSSHASTSLSGSRHSGSYISGAPSLASGRAPSYVSGAGSGAPSVAPSDSISQAGSRYSKRSSTMPSQLGSATGRSVGMSGTGSHAYGVPDHQTNKPFTAHGHTIIPAPGQTLDIYYV